VSWGARSLACFFFPATFFLLIAFDLFHKYSTRKATRTTPPSNPGLCIYIDENDVGQRGVRIGYRIFPVRSLGAALKVGRISIGFLCFKLWCMYYFYVSSEHTMDSLRIKCAV